MGMLTADEKSNILGPRAMYDSLGFQTTYLIMGSVVLIISIVALLFLEKPKFIDNLSDHSSEI